MRLSETPSGTSCHPQLQLEGIRTPPSKIVLDFFNILKMIGTKSTTGIVLDLVNILKIIGTEGNI